MHISNNKELLEILSQFTYYEVDNLKLKDDTIEFEYISVVKNVICKCLYTKYHATIRIDNQEWKRYLVHDDIFLNLADSDKVRNYINSLKVNGLNIKIDNDDIVIDCTYACINIDKINEVITLVDKIILNVFLLLDNKELIDLNDINHNICIYPHLSAGCRTLYNVHIMYDSYVNYMSYYYFDIISNTIYTKVMNQITMEAGWHTSDQLGCIYNFPHRDTEYKGRILNKNFITSIKLLGTLKVDNDIEIILENDKDLIIDTPTKWCQLNDKAISKEKCIIGKIFGDKLLLNNSKPMKLKFSPVLIF